MNELAEEFEQHRAYLRTIAYRMLGSVSDSDDAVQEAWIRLSRSDADAVENLRAWLTTVVARVCLDILRSRRARQEVYGGSWLGAVARSFVLFVIYSVLVGVASVGLLIAAIFLR